MKMYYDCDPEDLGVPLVSASDALGYLKQYPLPDKWVYDEEGTNNTGFYAVIIPEGSYKDNNGMYITFDERDMTMWICSNNEDFCCCVGQYTPTTIKEFILRVRMVGSFEVARRSIG